MRVLPCLQRILFGWKFLPKVKRIYARCGARSIPNFGATVQFCEAQSGWRGEMKKPLIQAAPTKISIERQGKNSEMTKVRIRNFHKSAQGHTTSRLRSVAPPHSPGWLWAHVRRFKRSCLVHRRLTAYTPFAPHRSFTSSFFIFYARRW